MPTGALKTALKVIYWNLVAIALVAAIGAAVVFRRIHRFDEMIVEVGRQQGVDPRLVSALIWRESRFDPTATGPKREVGLMQVTEEAAGEWARAVGRPTPSRADLFDPRTNIEAGTWYLGRAIRNWSDRSDPLPFALAEYNAGRSNVMKWAGQAMTPYAFWENIPYPTTKRYVEDILRRYRRRV